METLDLREWGDCPRLEDHYNPNWYVEEEYTWNGSDGEDQGDIIEGGDESREVPNDADNDDPEALDANSDTDNNSPEVFEADAAAEPDDMYDKYIPLFLKAMEDIGFGECTGEYRTCHKCRILQRDEDVLISLLVWNLPNLHTLCLVMPTEMDCILPPANAITSMLARADASGRADFLQNLRKVYVCSAMCKWMCRDSAQYWEVLRLTDTFRKISA